jgi:hypothetical protein
MKQPVSLLKLQNNGDEKENRPFAVPYLAKPFLVEELKAAARATVASGSHPLDVAQPVIAAKRSRERQ